MLSQLPTSQAPRRESSREVGVTEINMDFTFIACLCEPQKLVVPVS
jgi:hypothetical protein